MKQILIKKGQAALADVPVGSIGAGEILVQVRASCLSSGTELSGMQSTAIPMWKRAIKQPEKIATTVQLALSQGARRAWNAVAEKRDAAYPTGYSAAGVVVAIGAEITDLAPGDRVGCAGSPHAEYIRVSRNLCVKIPDSLDWEGAATITLGAIALQGIRRAQPTLGECFIVVGLGILGQLTTQLLRANGCRVIGLDLNRDRIELAKTLGLQLGLHSDDGNVIDQVVRLTNGYGADGVIITAATSSDEVISTAFKMCRKKGRVVLVGDVGLHLNRADLYTKEIDFFISTSYGPGRYDSRYEEQGIDYPLPYVRWTENRNMIEYLRLLAEGSVKIKPLISARYPIEKAQEAYAYLSNAANSMMILLVYPEENTPSHTISLNNKIKNTDGKIRVAIIGAGGFAKSTHLPNLHQLNNRFSLQAVVTRNGHQAKAIAQQYGASYCSTDFNEVLADPDVDAVIIATRHHLHGAIALAALEAGKHVLVEKPLALTHDEINALNTFIAGNKTHPVILTGYNRRFSPYANFMGEFVQKRSGPFMINYRMNAGYLTREHWVHGKEGGGRNLGEACHIYDLFTYLTQAKVTEISALSIMPQSNHYGRNDNFSVSLRFEDGSIANLMYTALGSSDYPKEMAELYCDGKIVVMKDYKRLDVYGIKEKSLATPVQNKGLQEELLVFANAINDSHMPIPWWQQYQVAMIGLAVEEQISHLNPL